ncbi:hypothetical protein O0550_08935 [Brevibacillus halotolerans]|uniref:hypothetical protein n=1 Tax=Brevibacillus TaxID=55080 RepID=UPI00215CF48E|nr:MULTISPECIES: hypothetical protein [Brevibacillus]MCR8963329.1 hypothetical protein [Brevibacillus laterosporus]MCZ0835485.1 hypothetical protein [Brevibacillus halotolerans]
MWYTTTLPNGEQRKIPWFDVLHLKAISKTGLKAFPLKRAVEVLKDKGDGK